MANITNIEEYKQKRELESDMKTILFPRKDEAEFLNLVVDAMSNQSPDEPIDIEIWDGNCWQCYLDACLQECPELSIYDAVAVASIRFKDGEFIRDSFDNITGIDFSQRQKEEEQKKLEGAKELVKTISLLKTNTSKQKIVQSGISTDIVKIAEKMLTQEKGAEDER